MKFLAVLAMLLIGGAVFYYTGGASTLGLTQPQDLPETITPPNATFIGDEYTNPYAE